MPAPLSCRWAGLLSWTMATLALLIALLCWSALLIRDRFPWSAILLYVPLATLTAIGLALAVWQWFLNRSRRRLLILLALLLVPPAWESFASSSWRTPPPVPGPTLRVLHWNVQWGGGLGRTRDRWARMADQIASERPDVVLLSEGPPRAWLGLLHDELGPGWSLAVAANEVHSPYAYNLCVLVRGEVLASDEVALGPGIGLSTLATIDGQLFRMLLVDSPSNPFGWKVPFLEAVARSVQTASDEGRPFDVVAGDFNVPSRSLAFPPVESAGPGYRLAGRWAFGTRKTWPSPLPLVDLDHVLIRANRALLGARPIRSWRSDHAGLVVNLSATVETGEQIYGRSSVSPAAFRSR